MFQALLKRAVPLPKLTEYQSYLFIGPHPDDIEVACAPSVKALTDAGKRVSFLIVTDGCMGALDPALFGDALANIRQSEARASAELLGVKDVVFLPFHDGGLYCVEDAAKAIAKEIARIKPQVVFAPDPNVPSECHADHIKVGLAAKMSMCLSPYASIMRGLGSEETHAPEALALYYTNRPNAYIPIKRYRNIRAAAAGLHKSQFDAAALEQITLYFTLRSVRLGLKRLSGPLDGYRALAPAHMHCFPEASEW